MRIIGHLDMDAFFASIEERDNPRFRGKPIVVGADPKDGAGRGVVSTANYKAREYGIRSAMPISKAWQLAEAGRRKGGPAVIFVVGGYHKYGAVSRKIMEILHRHVPAVEEASVDEAYLDLSFAETYERAEAICRAIKQDIFNQEHLTASAGIGPNKLIAKIASDMQKPNGLTVVREADAEQFLEPLSIRTIPGIGPKTEDRFRARGIRTIKDLKKFSREELTEMMGKWGAELYRKARGQSDSPVVLEYEVKSIGEQETFEIDSLDPQFILPRLQALAAGVMERFSRTDFKTYQAVVVTVRFADFETKSRTHTLAQPGSTLSTLAFEATRLILPFFDARENPRKKKIRLIGVRVEKLE